MTDTFIGFEATTLARIQFAFTVTFHIIFPAFTIGLSAFIATLLARHWWKPDDRLRRLARFWTKIFAVSFAMGVVSGIVLSYQFGTNWSRFSVVTGNVIGPLIGYEVLTAFFLEATFLGILLFGWDRVPQRLHLIAAILVAIGTATSAFWILSANSWMQTPAGHIVRDGIAYPRDWWAIVFNPSFPYRLAHMLSAAYLTTSVVVLAVGARYWLANRFAEDAKTMIRMGLGMVIVMAPLQLVIGDLHGLNTAKHQPAKLAAMEGHWDGSQPADLYLFAWPDQAAETNRYAVGIPRLASWIITRDLNGKFPGLKDFPRDQRPPVASVFWNFRIMVGIGMLLIATGAVGGFLWFRARLFEARWFLAPLQYAWPLGFVAIIAGWMVTEQGRQPWLVHGLLRTADAISPVPAASVALTLVLFVIVYAVVFSMGILYINKLIQKGPAPATTAAETGVPSRPLSGATDATRDALSERGR
jgi:cytochrome d ubiquinol oxidase subunit I